MPIPWKQIVGFSEFHSSEMLAILLLKESPQSEYQQEI